MADKPPGGAESIARRFEVARNPRADTRLPYLVRLPVRPNGIVLATREPWPGAKDAFCLQVDTWPDAPELVESVPVSRCWRRGRAVHLVLQRRQRKRSVFVWTEKNGRELVFWRTQKTMRTSRPGIRVPAARGLDAPLRLAVDVREQHPWRFADEKAQCEVRELPVGDYGVFVGERLAGVVERKSVADLATAAVGGTLGFALGELGAVPHAALVVEGRLSDLLKVGDRVRPEWLMSLVAGLQVEHPRVSWVFADNRALAQRFAFRWLAAARRAAADAAQAAAHVSAGKPDGGVETPNGTDSAGPVQAARVDAPDRGAGGDPAVGEETVRYRPGGTQLPLVLTDRRGRIDEALRLADGGREWTSRAYAERFGVTQQTAWKDLRKLVDSGALEAVGAGRGRKYRRPSRGT